MFNLLKKTWKSVITLTIYTVGVWATLSAIPFFVIIAAAKYGIKKKWDNTTHEKRCELTDLSLKLQDMVDFIPELGEEEGE
jgi:hypothetical protein